MQPVNSKERVLEPVRFTTNVQNRTASEIYNNEVHCLQSCEWPNATTNWWPKCRHNKACHILQNIIPLCMWRRHINLTGLNNSDAVDMHCNILWLWEPARTVLRKCWRGPSVTHRWSSPVQQSRQRIQDWMSNYGLLHEHKQSVLRLDWGVLTRNFQLWVPNWHNCCTVIHGTSYPLLTVYTTTCYKRLLYFDLVRTDRSPASVVGYFPFALPVFIS